MQNSQQQGAWDRQAADLQAPGEGNGECPRKEGSAHQALGGLESCPRGRVSAWGVQT